MDEDIVVVHYFPMYKNEFLFISFAKLENGWTDLANCVLESYWEGLKVEKKIIEAVRSLPDQLLLNNSG